MATISAYVPDDWTFRKLYDDKLASLPRNRASAYVRETLEAALTSPPVDVNALREDVLVFLTQELLGKPKAAKIAAMVADRDQVQVLAQLIDDFLLVNAVQPITAESSSEDGPAGPSAMGALSVKALKTVRSIVDEKAKAGSPSAPKSTPTARDGGKADRR